MLTCVQPCPAQAEYISSCTDIMSLSSSKRPIAELKRLLAETPKYSHLRACVKSRKVHPKEAFAINNMANCDHCYVCLWVIYIS